METAVDGAESLEKLIQQRADESVAVWSEFCRVALTEKCETIERDLRERDPVEFSRVYGKV